MKVYEYYINLDERGMFYADVRNPEGVTVFEIKIEPYEKGNIFDDRWMKHKNDLAGLKEYLQDLGIMDQGDVLYHGQKDNTFAKVKLNNKTVKISKKKWEEIGRKSNWMKRKLVAYEEERPVLSANYRDIQIDIFPSTHGGGRFYAKLDGKIIPSPYGNHDEDILLQQVQKAIDTTFNNLPHSATKDNVVRELAIEYKFPIKGEFSPLNVDKTPKESSGKKKIKISKATWEKIGRKKQWINKNAQIGPNQFGHGLSKEALKLLESYGIGQYDLWRYDTEISRFKDIYQGIQEAKNGNLETLKMALKQRYGF